MVFHGHSLVLYWGDSWCLHNICFFKKRACGGVGLRGRQVSSQAAEVPSTESTSPGFMRFLSWPLSLGPVWLAKIRQKILASCSSCWLGGVFFIVLAFST